MTQMPLASRVLAFSSGQSVHPFLALNARSNRQTSSHEVGVLTQSPANQAIAPPSDGAFQAFAQVRLGSPAGGRRQPGAVREEGSNLGAGRARTSGPMLERLSVAREFADQFDQPPHRDGLAAAGIVRLAKLDPRRDSDR